MPGTLVYLAVCQNPARKTKYDLIAVEKARAGKSPLLINMDSAAPNAVAAEWLPKSGLFSPAARFKREVTYGGSRFDFYIEDGDTKAFLEVKGCTLEEDGVARFPDAPTERGVKHIRELIACHEAGYKGYILFVVQMKEIDYLCPNDATHRAFGDALREAAAAGVGVLAVDCTVTPDTLTADTPIPVQLEECT